jgi:hypothetical protein
VFSFLNRLQGSSEKNLTFNHNSSFILNRDITLTGDNWFFCCFMAFQKPTVHKDTQYIRGIKMEREGLGCGSTSTVPPSKHEAM